MVICAMSYPFAWSMGHVQDKLWLLLSLYFLINLVGLDDEDGPDEYGSSISASELDLS